MVVDELSLDFVVHVVKRIESALEITSELGARIDHSLHDLVAVILGDTGAEREILEVTADTDSSALDQGSLLG